MLSTLLLLDKRSEPAFVIDSNSNEPVLGEVENPKVGTSNSSAFWLVRSCETLRLGWTMPAAVSCKLAPGLLEEAGLCTTNLGIRKIQKDVHYICTCVAGNFCGGKFFTRSKRHSRKFRARIERCGYRSYGHKILTHEIVLDKFLMKI